MAGRTTSSYHQRCIAPSLKALEETTHRRPGEKMHAAGAYRECNAVAQERIWTEGVKKELTAARDWDKRWGFTTEYDLKDQKREKKPLPENISYYDTKQPHTSSQKIGAGVQGVEGRTMMELERLTNFRKKGSDIKNNYKWTY